MHKPQLSIPPTLQWQTIRDRQNFLAPGVSAEIPGVLDILDQTKLPGEVVRLQLQTPEEVYSAIKTLAVRGAPAIGCAAALGLAACAQRLDSSLNTEQFREEIRRIADYLDSSRPTAVNLHWALERCRKKCQSAPDRETMLQLLLDEALSIVHEDIEMCSQIGEYGKSLFHQGSRVLTHCNAGALATAGMGTALAPVYAAHLAGLAPEVYSDETRPLLQGARLTAWELHAAGIPVTTQCDSMAAQLMQKGLIDLIIVGADRVAANGDTANKIGTCPLAIAAQYYHVPFYVAMPYSTIDYGIASGEEIPIEQRAPEEIFHCEGVKVYNPAFDVTPRSLITGFITEKGIFSSLGEISR